MKTLSKQYNEHGLKWGIIQFLIVGVLFYVLYFVNLRFAVTSGMWVTLPISISILVIQGVQARKFNNGALSYGEAFRTLFIASVISSALFTTTNFLVKTTNPAFAEEEQAITIEKTAERMAGWGMDDDKIDEAIEKMEEKDARPSIFDSIIFFVASSIFSTLLILIIAIFVKKKPVEKVIVVDNSTT